MKNLKILLSLVICFTFLTTSVATAQQVVNNTNCDFLVKIGHANPSSCNNVSYVILTVPANATVNYTLPTGNVIIEAKGTRGGTLCTFYIGNPCSPYPNSVTLPCPCTSSGSYSAGLSTSIDILLQ